MPYKDPEVRRAFQREYQRRRRAENPERERTQSRARYDLHKEVWNARQGEYNRANRARINENRRRNHAANPEKARAYFRLDYANNLERYYGYKRKFREANREKDRAGSKRWRQANPGKVRANELKRKFHLEQRTPAWVDMTELNALYLVCPDGMEVDHVVPLDGITVDGYKVSGLHVLWNLQFLTKSANSGKRNRMRPEDGITATSA
jgi:hypothetical protein